MKIYLVNGNSIMNVSIKGILQITWDVQCFDNAAVFLKKIKNEEGPAIIIIDININMQSKSGLDIYNYIKNKPRLRDFPVIFITDSSVPGEELSCLQAGASDYIQAPFIPEVFYQRVDNVINQYKAFNAMMREVKNAKKQAQQASSFNKEYYKKVTYQVLTALSSTIDAKDYYTKGHSTRVAEYSLAVGKELGLSQNDLEILYHGALLHDIGKIGISDAILRKNGSLSDVEYEIIKKHPVTGYNILKTITLMPDIAKCARWHHEKYDGTGYPDGLTGVEIPLFSRIIGVVDAFDAMTSDRSYRKAMSVEDARIEIINNKGYQFDPITANALLKLLDEEKKQFQGKGKAHILLQCPPWTRQSCNSPGLCFNKNK